MSARQHFKKSVKLREQHPLSSGEYKLREANSHFERFLEEVNILADCRRKKIPMRGRCTNGDHPKWLKDLPAETIPYYLGYYLLPAINALDKDGVPVSKIKQSLPFFEQIIENLLDRCDDAYNLIKKRIDFEYELWDQDDSVLIPLLDTCFWLVEVALDMLPPPKKPFCSNLTEVTD